MYTRLSQIPAVYRPTYFIINNDAFAKGDKLFRLPMWNKDESAPSEEAYSAIKEFITKSTDKLYELIDEENVEAISYAGLGHENFTLMNHRSEKFHKYAQNQKSPEISGVKEVAQSRNERIRKLHYTSKNFIRINYSLDGKATLVRSNSLNNMMQILVPESEHPKKRTITFEQFSDLVDSMVLSIDNLFTQQNIKPTSEKRDNLISLAYGLNKSLRRGKKFNELLGTTPETYCLTHPALIKAAAKGYNDGILKMFYVNKYNPKSIEDISFFENMPFDMLEAVLGKN